MQHAMIAVPAPIGTARPSRAPSAPAPSTPSSPAPSPAAKTMPTVTSLSPAWVSPIRPLTPHSAFCARDQQSMVAARTVPERRCGRSDAPSRRPSPPGGSAPYAPGSRRVGRPHQRRHQRDRGERGGVSAAEVRDRQIERARRRGDREQAERGRPVGVALGGDTGRGHRRGRAGAEAADDRARHDERDQGGEGGGTVPGDREEQAEPGEAARPVPFDPGGESEAGRRRAQQQGGADKSGLRRGRVRGPPRDGRRRWGGGTRRGNRR